MTDLLPAQAETIERATALRTAIDADSADMLDMVLREARTHYAWTDRPVDKADLEAAWGLAAMGPTSMNCQPLRVVWISTPEGKDRLLPHVMEGNIAKVKAAPVTAILAHDTAFFEQFEKVFPINPGAGAMFASNADLAETTAFRNGTLQAGYLIVALRAQGFDVAGMSGFNNAGVDSEFFGDGPVTSNFLLNVGYADPGGVFPRLPRLSFSDVSTML